MLSLYFHIPFCRKVCGYCDFFRSADLRPMPLVLEKMMEEMELRVVENRGDSNKYPCSCQKGAELGTVYFGGGTPSLLSIEQLRRVMERVDNLFDLSSLRELTLEANPDDLSLEYLEGLRRLGFDRISLGVQSFDDQLLQFMGRRHSAQQAIEAINNARKVGFDNIAIDLIYGIDCFGDDVLKRSLKCAIECDVQHVAAYHLTIEPNSIFGKKLAKGELKQVDESVSEHEFELVREALISGGFEHYEVSNFAKKGCRSIHNSNYWSGNNYVGIGAGAHSFVDGVRCWTEGSVQSYIHDGIDRYIVENLTEQQRRNEMIMLALRCVEGLSLKRFVEEFGQVQSEMLLKECRRFIESGDLVIDGDYIKIPPERFLVSDMIIEALFI